MTHAIDNGAKRSGREIASREICLRPSDVTSIRSIAYVLGATLAWGCSVYEMPSARSDLTGGDEAGSTTGEGGAGGAGGVAGSSGQGGVAGSSGQGGNGVAGGAGTSGGSAGQDGGGGSSGTGGQGDEAGASDASDRTSSEDADGGGPADSTDARSPRDADGESSAGDADSTDAGKDGTFDVADTVDVCDSESDATFCLRVGKNCGIVNGLNSCGAAVSINCGVCSSPLTCGGAGQPNVCGSPTSVAKGGTVTASSPGTPPEDMTKAFDENSSTKWYAGDNVSKGWIAYQFASGVTRTVTSYAITSANDMPLRDPATWQLEGSSDGQSWTSVDARTGESFATRFQTKTYSPASPMAYGHYRLNVTANAGATALQVADLQLLGY
jgi:hypothetical protein